MATAWAGFGGPTIARESGGGVRARHRQYAEPHLVAFGRLIARNRRRYGGYIVHTGLVVLFVAFPGMAFKTQTAATLKPDESASLRSPHRYTHSFTPPRISPYDALNRQVTPPPVASRRDGN